MKTNHLWQKTQGPLKLPARERLKILKEIGFEALIFLKNLKDPSFEELEELGNVLRLASSLHSSTYSLSRKSAESRMTIKFALTLAS